jgi:hypothetical protein
MSMAPIDETHSFNTKMERRSDNIRSRGAEYFDQIVADREEETLHLEFKTLSHDGGQLKKDDKKLIATAVAGLANAEGGVLVIGIETERVDGVDVAVASRSIKQLQRTTNLIRAAIPEMLSPQHTGIDVFATEETSKKDEGFIVIDVPESIDRPHYSNVHHQYFRRGSDRTRVMEHGEVRDLMFATKEGILELVPSIRLGHYSSDLKFGMDLVLTLRNVGRVPVRAPYVRIAGGGWHPWSTVDPRPAREGTTGYYTTTDVITHVHDEFGLASLPTGLDFRRTGLYELKVAVAAIKKDNWHALMMMPFSAMPQRGEPATNQTVHVSGHYGAENAVVKTVDLTIDKKVLLDMFCQAKKIA